MRYLYALGVCFFVCASAPHASAEVHYPFYGGIDMRNKTGSIIFDLGSDRSAGLHVTEAEDGTFDVTAKIDHLVIGSLDITTELVGSLTVVASDTDSGSFVHGAVRSQYSLINYKPAHEFSGHIKIQDGRLYFESFSWGNLAWSGHVELGSSRDMNIKATLDRIRAVDLLLFLGCDPDASGFSGSLSGEVSLSGALDRAIIKGSIHARDGFMGNDAYNDIKLNFEGLYPTLYFTDSRFTAEDGLSFNMSGSMHLGDQCDFSTGLSDLKISPLIYENKDVREWTIRKREEEGSIRSSELKYSIRKEDTPGLSIKEDSGLLGVEGSIKF